jgi:hypothetical protein
VFTQSVVLRFKPDSWKGATMMSKFGFVAMILAMTAGCARVSGDGGSGPDSEVSPITVSAYKNQSYLMPLDDGKTGGGYLLRVPLKVPSGTISGVDYSCDGSDECAHVFECPASVRCGPDHAERVTYDGDQAIWWGWTDSGMVKDAVLKFKVHVTGAEPENPPC